MKKCQITEKKTIVGNNVSNSVRRTKRKFYPNLQKRKIWSTLKKKFIKIIICKKALKTIDKYGIENVKIRNLK